jgi:hypothetical protein
MRGEIVDSHHDVIARIEATKQSTLSCCDMDCFASLAMTAESTRQIVDLPHPHRHVREHVALIGPSDPVSVPALVFHDHGGADGDAIIQILYVLIGHASKRRFDLYFRAGLIKQKLYAADIFDRSLSGAIGKGGDL